MNPLTGSYNKAGVAATHRMLKAKKVEMAISAYLGAFLLLDMTRHGPEQSEPLETVAAVLQDLRNGILHNNREC